MPIRISIVNVLDFETMFNSRKVRNSPFIEFYILYQYHITT